MLAAENGALPRGKVGGIGDVIAGLPRALAATGWASTVMTPAYGIFSQAPGARSIAGIEVAFAGQTETVEVFEVPDEEGAVTHLVLEHPRFSPQGAGKIYCDDGDWAPFATDASKFAFFCAAAATCIREQVVTPDVIHLHDWHAAMLLALRAFAPEYAALQDIRTVYTIHNLALQGIRPLAGHESAFSTWFPELNFHYNMVVDPRYHDCVNPMALAIRLADKINTVSPTYALEILEADDPAHGFYGGEGLELDLQVAAGESRLVGILNGCEYAPTPDRQPAWKTLRDSMLETLRHWISCSTYVHAAHFLALNKITARFRRKPTSILLSIGRITPQKVGLFLETTSSGRTALEDILEMLDVGELFVLLGNGDDELERALSQIAHRHRNFLFLKGYIDELPDLLYRSAELFLMPSTFEPCGISQMQAMRESVPCVVHGVGGLRDTVEHKRTGFVFDGHSPREQANNFVNTVRTALDMKATDPESWQALCEAAGAVRFSWDHAARAYASELYAHHDT